jgi:hypothetical protein
VKLLFKIAAVAMMILLLPIFGLVYLFKPEMVQELVRMGILVGGVLIMMYKFVFGKKHISIIRVMLVMILAWGVSSVIL